ncbi:MAG: hypothetical protein GKS06_04860 [Acidobacteria bacterium]|nr:hypothetical protein [Acidobacteriota bacterium]
MNDPAKAARDHMLLEQLEPDTARMLFPERFPAPLRVTLQHPPLEPRQAETLGPLLEKADDRDWPEDGDWSVTYALSEVEALHRVFAQLDATFGSAAVTVLINGKDLPMARELWLPLFWQLRS